MYVIDRTDRLLITAATTGHRGNLGLSYLGGKVKQSSQLHLQPPELILSNGADEEFERKRREATRERKRGTFNFAVSQAIHTITFC